MKIASFLDTWQDFLPQTKKLLKGMFALGVVAFGLGLTLDFFRSPLLKEFTYWPNIFVTVTGFLIGVPVALVGLSTITGEREEKAADDRVDTLSRLAWERFCSSVHEFCNDARYQALTVDVQSMREAQTVAYEAISDYIHKLRAKELHQKFNDTLYFEHDTKRRLQHDEFMRYGTPLRRLDNSADELYAVMRASHGPFALATDAVSKNLGRDQALEVEWSIVRRNWETLDQYVRIQRLERGMDWFSPRVDATLRNLMAGHVSPISEFSKTVRNTLNQDGMMSSGKAMDTMNLYMSIERSELDHTILVNPNLFGHRMVDSEQFEAAELAAAFISDLKGLVSCVNKSRWPSPKMTQDAEKKLRDAARYHELIRRRYSVKEVMDLYPD